MLGTEEVETEVICVLGILWFLRTVVVSGMKMCKNTMGSSFNLLVDPRRLSKQK